MSLARQLTSQVAKPVARSVVRSAGGGTPASLDIKANVGTSTSPTSTGTKAVTGVGFEPKVVMPWGVLHTLDAVTTNAYLGLGALTGTSQSAISVSSLTGLTTSNTDRRHGNTNAVTQLIDGTVSEAAARSALGADGFTLNWTTAAAAANILNHICLGGDDLEVSLTQHQMNGTNAPQSFAHGLTGGEPTALLFFSAINNNTPANTQAGLLSSIGCWASSSQFSAANYADNAKTTTETRRSLVANSIWDFITTTSLRRMAVSSVDAANVNCTYPATTSNIASYFWLLAIRGAKCQAGAFDCNGSTDPLTIACSGITPKLFLPLFVPSGVDSIGTVQNGLLFGIGASDGTNNVSCGVTDANGVTTTNARRYQSSTSLVEYDTAGTKQFEATASFSGESVILDPTTNGGSTWGQGGYLIIGA